MSEEKEGSLFKVPLTSIVAIGPHANADRLEIATVYGFQVVVKKGQYKVGDAVVYIPIDSVLPEWLEEKLFPMVKDPVTGVPMKPPFALHGGRVRQIRIRKLASQGMLVNTMDVTSKVNFKKVRLEADLSEELGVTKYEPPVAGPSLTQGKDKQRNKSYEHPLFHKYNGLDNIKWFATAFQEGEEVVIQEKLHGTNARASVLPYRTNSLIRKIKKFLGLAPKYEQCYGSNNVQKAVGNLKKEVSEEARAVAGNKGSFYSEDVWGSTFKALDVFSKLRMNETVFGEICGPGIQSNYDYGLKEHRFFLFDVKILRPDGSQVWLSPDAVEAFAKERGFDMVPVLYSGTYDKEVAYRMTTGPSLFDPKTKVREGIVIKAKENYSVEGNKRAYKWVSEVYLDDKSNTDNH